MDSVVHLLCQYPSTLDSAELKLFPYCFSYVYASLQYLSVSYLRKGYLATKSHEKTPEKFLTEKDAVIYPQEQNYVEVGGFSKPQFSTGLKKNKQERKQGHTQPKQTPAPIGKQFTADRKLSVIRQSSNLVLTERIIFGPGVTGEADFISWKNLSFPPLRSSPQILHSYLTQLLVGIKFSQQITANHLSP